MEVATAVLVEAVAPRVAERWGFVHQSYPVANVGARAVLVREGVPAARLIEAVAARLVTENENAG